MLEDFFKEVSEAYAKQKAYHDERVKNGDYFNVFNVLGLSSNETRTHSAFIAELLNPYGSHGLGDFFLKKFISQMRVDNLNLDLPKAFVEVERVIGAIDENYDKGGRIDIIIEDGKKAIIIENKIYAQDQYKQLVRYNNYAKSTFQDYRLLYLTLNKDSASESSTQDDQGQLLPHEDYLPITYREYIINWLEDCANEISTGTVKVIIKQYIDLLKQLTYQMEENNFILDVIKKDEYKEYVLEILKNQYEWKNDIWKSFCDDLKVELDKHGLLFESLDIFAFKVKKRAETPFYIRMTYEAKGSYIGITGTEEMSVAQSFPGYSGANPWWPCGWKYLDGDYQSIKPNNDIESIRFLFPENRKELIAYLLREIIVLQKIAEKVGINI